MTRVADPYLLPAGALVMRPDEAVELWAVMQWALSERAVRGIGPPVRVSGPLLSRWRTVAELDAARRSASSVAEVPSSVPRYTRRNDGVDDEWISTTAAAARLGVSREYVGRVAARPDGVLRRRRGRGRAWLISVSSLERFEQARTKGETA